MIGSRLEGRKESGGEGVSRAIMDLFLFARSEERQ